MTGHPAEAGQCPWSHAEWALASSGPGEELDRGSLEVADLQASGLEKEWQDGN